METRVDSNGVQWSLIRRFKNHVRVRSRGFCDGGAAQKMSHDEFAAMRLVIRPQVIRLGMTLYVGSTRGVVKSFMQPIFMCVEADWNRDGFLYENALPMTPEDIEVSAVRLPFPEEEQLSAATQKEAQP